MGGRIAIVGGAGFVGTNLAMLALERGHEVVLYDVGDRLERLSCSGLDDHDGVTFVDGDVAHSPMFIPDDVSAVVHLAALAHVDYSLYRPEFVIDNNLLSLTRALTAASEQEIPVLFTSSVEVYGGSDGGCFPESSRLEPLSPYAASKVGCESILQSYRAAFGLSATTARLTNLYGPWQAPDRLIPRLVTQALAGQPSEVECGRLRDFVYVEDAAEALLTIVDWGLWGETYNVSSAVPVDNVDVADIIRTSVESSSELHARPPKRRDGRGRSLIGCPEKLRSAAGWQCRTSLADGVRQTAAWYEANPDWWRQFESNISVGRSGPEFLIDYTVELTPAVTT